MEQQVLHWSTLAVALLAGLTILFLKRAPRNDRRSFGQWMILLLYKAAARFFALVRAIDFGYLEYRRMRGTLPFQIENEKALGKLVKASGSQDNAPEALKWTNAEN